MRYLIDVDDRLKIDKLFEQAALPEIVYFTGELTEESANEFRRDLEVAETNARAAKQEVLPICLDSFGGDVYALMSCIDAMDACGVTLATVIEGKVMSAGAILATCGAKGHRYMGPNATFMIHSASSGDIGGKVEEVEADVRELRRLYEVALFRMAKNCERSDEFFIEMIQESGNAELYLTAQQCKELGIIDYIGIPSLRTKITAEHELKL